MQRETLKVVWKIIRKAGYGRTKQTYCSYVIENENRFHKLRTEEGTKLFDLLKNNIISNKDRYMLKVYVDGMYFKNELIYVTNFRVI